MAYSCSVSAQPLLKLSNPSSHFPSSLPPGKHRLFISSTTAHVDPSPTSTHRSHLGTKNLILPLLAGPRTQFSVHPSAHMIPFPLVLLVYEWILTWEFLDFVCVAIRSLHRENMVQWEGRLLIRPIKRNSHGLQLYSRMLFSELCLLFDVEAWELRALS